ncbi:MAG: ferredoxin [Actinobacteria bacterium]|nr:ferredoxin [Actinomycetota bacterium]
MTVRITIDPGKCQGYGQCCFEADDIFLLGDEPPVRASADVAEDRRADAERAADVCPMQAITVE